MPNERRTGTDRRLADTREPAPTGEGAVVLEAVNDLINGLIEVAQSPHVSKPLNSIESLQALQEDLQTRAETGKTKYGTYLRVNNGRNSNVDFYQEICDAIMYAAQARAEGKSTGRFLELLINIGAQTAADLDKQ